MLTVLAVLFIGLPIAIYLLFCLYSLIGKLFGFGVWSHRPPPAPLVEADPVGLAKYWAAKGPFHTGH
jgi:hypothetical protein